MKLWHVSRPGGCGYDEYDSFVCAAETAAAARLIHPIGVPSYSWNGVDWIKTESWSKSADNAWDAPDSLEVKELGTAADGIEGVVCASFHAG